MSNLAKSSILPLVTVITPLYNKVGTIDQTVRSVLSQSYTNFEYIVVNNNSNDGSLDIVSKFQDSRLRILNCEEQGVSYARNLALEQAKGEFIAFLDADDCLGPRSIEIRVKALIDNKDVGIVIGDYTRVYTGKQQAEIVPSRVELQMLKHQNYIPMLTAMVRQSSLNGARFVAAEHEDYIFWITILRSTNAIKVVDNEAYYGATRPGISSNKLKSAIWHYRALRSEFAISAISAVGFTIRRSAKIAMRRWRNRV